MFFKFWVCRRCCNWRGQYVASSKQFLPTLVAISSRSDRFCRIKQISNLTTTCGRNKMASPHVVSQFHQKKFMRQNHWELHATCRLRYRGSLPCKRSGPTGAASALSSCGKGTPRLAGLRSSRYMTDSSRLYVIS
jgi:hypothetical protein